MLYSIYLFSPCTWNMQNIKIYIAILPEISQNTGCLKDWLDFRFNKKCMNYTKAEKLTLRCLLSKVQRMLMIFIFNLMFIINTTFKPPDKSPKLFSKTRNNFVSRRMFIMKHCVQHKMFLLNGELAQKTYIMNNV